MLFRSRFVNAWSDAVAGGEEEEEEEEEEDEEEDEDDEEEGDSDSALDSASPCPSSPLQNRLEEQGSDQDSTGNPLGEGEEGMRERRDSGVGASLTRTNRWVDRQPRGCEFCGVLMCREGWYESSKYSYKDI